MILSSEIAGKAPAHIPVLKAETLEYLAPRDGGRYLDGTLGLAGHASLLLTAAPEALLLGLDQDPEALALAHERLAPFGSRVQIRQARFADFEVPLAELGWDGLDGALIDIGVSSLQLDTPERGFSFLHDGPLDMRMNPSSGAAPAARLVNRGSFEELKLVIAEYGEDPQAGRIARAIVEARAKKPITSTLELAAVVEKAYPPAWRAKARNHPATRTFQALRLVVNDELGQLKNFLAAVTRHLVPGGRLVVISFHSLEDRIVKHYFREEATGCLCPRHIPRCTCGHTARLEILTKKPVTPLPSEVKENPRSASAKLRAAVKLPEADHDC